MTVHEQLEKAICTKSKECDRCVIALGRTELGACGFALVAPDCILMAQEFGPVIFDLCLN